ncbi:ribosome assembly protein 4 [Nostoc sp. FACHB-87]|uniref:WD40 domain-containing protein n=1 Tax=Nostocaceae TaxID=1162 RepID=UPI0016868F1D|nr:MULTISPECIES: ribosome assembly protein 4 [Nostocaceae]MBD2459261.1 ribosome assembly protein 4 [Nostoc sp. FACHB-87]MBD2480255.1 ribosome assembly protein 4 [Anabaena sp. FACHB-83]
MTDSQENEARLQELAWAIETSVGQFKLILARCNYAKLRDRLIARLQEICEVEIRVLHLKPSERTLHKAIQEEFGDNIQALMITGLETLRDLPQMLTSANQVREEFRRSFSFPLVLWVNDEIYQQFSQLAPDLESWATTNIFTISSDELTYFIQQTATELFANSFNITLELCTEIKSAWQELQNTADFFTLNTQANCQFLRGLVAYIDQDLDAAITYYQQSLAFWQISNNLERQGQILSQITICYYAKARQLDKPNPPAPEGGEEELPFPRRRGAGGEVKTEIIQQIQNYLNQSINAFELAQRPDLIANSLEQFGIVLRYLNNWHQLKNLAERALQVHQAENNKIKIAQDYNYLAAVALAQANWQPAQESAKTALDILANYSDVTTTNYDALRQELLFNIAQAQQHLKQYQIAINNLAAARVIGITNNNPEIYLKILDDLRQLFLQQKQYLPAFDTKLEIRSIEQQFGLRAFLGAGRLEAAKQAGTPNITPLKLENKDSIAPEIAASGRQLDIEQLIERIGRHDYKLIVIHGQSGVGKSSLVNAGLVPALKNKAIGYRDNLPVVMRGYSNWVRELARLMGEGRSLSEVETPHSHSSTPPPPRLVSEVEPPPPHSLLNQLKENEQNNLRTVLIFDQFEEFFFDTEPKERRQFFEFLGECLNVLSAKVILSLRVDYLHYLLECNDLSSMKIIANDILSRNVLYKLGNFSPENTKSIIERLTQNTSFRLEPALIDQLVQDLAEELGEVRPIELQVVGAQLQTENIRTLAEYRQRATKQQLVQRYLDEVVNDCGGENKQIAEVLLYLLTDEKGTRPLKTRAELERDLQQFMIPPTPLKRGSPQAGGSPELVLTTNQLDLVLEIFVKSGLVMLLPETPADRYQLVHDYLAAFIRQQQEPKLKEIMAELEKERQQRKLSEAKLNSFLKRALFGSVTAGIVLAGLAVTAWNAAQQADKQRKQAEISEINALNNSSEALLVSAQHPDALIEALKAGGRLKQAPWAKSDTQMRTVATLNQGVYLQAGENPANRAIAVEGKTLEGHSSSVWSVSFSPDGKTLASGSGDNTIKLWDISTGKLLKTLSGHSSSVYSVSFSPDGKTLASGSDDNTIKLWDVSTGKFLKTLPSERYAKSGHSSSVWSVSFSPDGQTLASGSTDNTIKLWDISTGKPLKTLSGHSSPVISVSFSPDGKTLASGSGDNTIKLWDVSTGKLLKTLSGHSSEVKSVSFSPDGKTLASGSGDNTIKLWDVSTGKLLKTLSGHSNWVNSVSFSPDGQTLASGSGSILGDDNTIKLWDISTGKPLKTLSGHSSPVNSVSFSPDGKTLASGSGDNTIKLWDVSTGKLLRTLNGHNSPVNSVSFSPDSQILASGSDDKTIKLWDVSTGKLLKTLSGHSNWVYSVSFSLDGKTLASGSSDNTIKLWDLNLDNLLDSGCTLLNNYLIAHPETLEEVKECQTPSRLMSAATVLVTQGEKLAQNDDVNAAVAKFRRAKQWNQQLNFDPQAKATEFNNPVKAQSKLVEGQQLVKYGKVSEAVTAYTDAQKLDPKIEISADAWNTLCRQGSLRKQAQLVLFACDKAVTLAPDDGVILDSRGLARALTGDTPGAIADFEAFIAWSDNKDYKAQRQRWVKELKAGQNPFTDAELKGLLNQ